MASQMSGCGFMGTEESRLCIMLENRWFSRYVIAAMLVDSKQKIAH